MTEKTEIMKAPQSGITRETFGSREIETTGETVSSVLAARAKAEVEARFIVAMQRPRDWDNVRSKLLRACERPGFAGHATEKVWGAAWYKKPIGDGVEGFSIRFAEEALRTMGNMDARSSILWEDDQKRLVQVEVMDLENNLSLPTVIVVPKTIERKFLKKGEVAISTRINSYGEPVHLRASTDDEVMQVQNSLTSKALRNGILRLLPGDIQAECRQRIMEIRHGDIAKDPDGAKKRISDSFAQLNVNPSDLNLYLNHDLGTCSPAEISALRDLWQVIKDGKTTWHTVISSVLAERGESPEPAPPKKSAKDKIKERGQKPKRKQPKTEPQEAATVERDHPGGHVVGPKSSENASFEPVAESPNSPLPISSGMIADEVGKDHATENVDSEVEQIDAFDLLQEKAISMWGKKWTDALSHRAEQAGISFSKMTASQASKLLDALNNESEGYGGQ